MPRFSPDLPPGYAYAETPEDYYAMAERYAWQIETFTSIGMMNVVEEARQNMEDALAKREKLKG